MADLTDKTDDIAIWNEGRTKAVDVITDAAAVNRLAVEGIVKDEVVSNIDAGKAYSHNMTHTLGNNETFYHLLVTPNTATRIHLRFSHSSTGPIEISFWEAPTTTANGSAADEFNRNRNVATASVLTLFHAPTVTSIGTTMLVEYSIGASGGAKAGVSESDEFVLKQNTKYVFRYISGQANNEVSEEMFWYEV